MGRGWGGGKDVWYTDFFNRVIGVGRFRILGGGQGLEFGGGQGGGGQIPSRHMSS